MKTYHVKALGKAGETVLLESFPWDENGYRPRTEATLHWSDRGLHVHMRSYETEIRAAYRQFGDRVCEDSCMEFFFQPLPDSDPRFLHFEVNPLGVMYTGIMTCRADMRRVMDCDPASFEMHASVSPENLEGYRGPHWEISYLVPLTHIVRFFPDFRLEPGMRFRGNFYKCGDLTRFPHYGSWSPIDHPTPEFLLSQYFGEFMIE